MPEVVLEDRDPKPGEAVYAMSLWPDVEVAICEKVTEKRVVLSGIHDPRPGGGFGWRVHHKAGQGNWSFTPAQALERYVRQLKDEYHDAAREVARVEKRLLTVVALGLIEPVLVALNVCELARPPRRSKRRTDQCQQSQAPSLES